MLGVKFSNKQAEDAQLPIPLSEFLVSYNQTIPANFPAASVALLTKFKETHTELFKEGDLWSLDKHRKKIIDWLPGNLSA